MEEAITALLAGVASGRRYWGRAPQSAARPFIVLNRIDGQRSYTTQAPTNHVASRVQVDCYGDTYTSAKGIARAATAVLSGYSGGIIQGIFVDGERDLPASDAGEVNHLFRVSIDIMVHTGEST